MSVFSSGEERPERRGRKAGGVPMQVRRCIMRVLDGHKSGEEGMTTKFSIDSVLNSVDDGYQRGPLRQVTVIMPDFSLAVRELLLRREEMRRGGRVEMKGVIAEWCRNNDSPSKIMRILPERGPGSGHARTLIAGLLKLKVEDLKVRDIEELQKAVDKVWRGVLSRLIELCLENEEAIEEDGVEWFPPEVYDGDQITRGFGDCSECGRGAILNFDEVMDEIFCSVCGLTNTKKQSLQ